MLKLYIQILLCIIILFPPLIIILILAALLFTLSLVYSDENVLKFYRNVLLAIDQTFNAMLGGDCDESISSRTAKAKDTQLWAKYLSKFLDLFEKDHCDKSIEEDEGKDQILED